MPGSIRDRGTHVTYKDKNIQFAGSGRLNQRNVVEFYDDFVGDTLDTFLTAVNKDAGATDWAVPATALAGGAATAVSGNTDDQKAEMAGPLIFLPSKGLIFEARVHLSSVSATTTAIALGFTDARNEGATTIAVAATGGTPTLTTTASDAALWLFDTDCTGSALKWLGVGVKGDTDATAVNSAIAPVASTYNTLRIEIDTSGNAVYKVLDDSQPWAEPLYIGYQANAVTTSTLLCPYIALQNRATNANKTATLDYWFAAQLSR